MRVLSFVVLELNIFKHIVLVVYFRWTLEVNGALEPRRSALEDDFEDEEEKEKEKCSCSAE